MPPSQPDRLPGTGRAARKAHRNDDYVDLFPRGVFPSGDIDILTTEGHILVIKSYEWNWDPTPRQKQLWTLMTKYGSPPDAPGSVTVACVWGLGNTGRELQIYDHTGSSIKRPVTRDEWRAWLSDWWIDHGGRRR